MFVILADHNAGSAGRENLPIKKYQIPLWIYSPKHLEAQMIAKRGGQIDVAPTILAILNMDYESWFFGQDMLSERRENSLALIGNYQYLGLYQQDILSILKPKKQTVQYTTSLLEPSNKALAEQNFSLLEKTIAYYQTAAYLLKNRMNAWSVNNEKIKASSINVCNRKSAAIGVHDC